MQFQCSCCGKTHESWPAIAFSSPDPYACLNEGERRTLGRLTSDFCTIEYEDQTDRFIRVAFEQKVVGGCQQLDCGAWVSLSQKSFEDYQSNFHRHDHEATYFGWLCNNLLGYEATMGIPVSVATRPNRQRPEIFPHEDFDHPFVRDFYDGIPLAEAEARIEKMSGIVAKRN